MLLEFSVANWMSFRDESFISLVASLERQHRSRVARSAQRNLRVLPLAAIFGGNAAGKSNFLQAVAFVQELVLAETGDNSSSQARPFKLASANRGEPSCFRLQILLPGDRLYRYDLEVLGSRVAAESLRLDSKGGVRQLFAQRDGNFDLEGLGLGDEQRRALFSGHDQSRTCLSRLAEFGIHEIQPLFEWFSSSLHVWLSADAGGQTNSAKRAYSRLPRAIDHLRELEIWLTGLDTGITSAWVRHVGTVADTGALSRESGLNFAAADSGTAREIAIGQVDLDGSTVELAEHEISAGTKRLIELFPIFLAIQKPQAGHTFLVDEFDRSLHPLLVLRLLEYFQAGCSEISRNQLIFTVQDLALMDQSSLRRDEIWLVERYGDGDSEINSVSDFGDLRFDKDLRKQYRQGLLGGVPVLAAVHSEGFRFGKREKQYGT